MNFWVMLFLFCQILSYDMDQGEYGELTIKGVPTNSNVNVNIPNEEADTVGGIEFVENASKITVIPSKEKEKLEFKVVPQSSINLLIQLNLTSNIQVKNNDSIQFSYQAIGEKGQPISTKETKSYHNYQDIPPEITIYSLDENTLYRVTLEENSYIQGFSVEAKTFPKSDANPAKPDFKYEINNFFGMPRLNIIWLPCGEERNCSGKMAGSHFSIKYRLLHSKHQFKFEVHRGTSRNINVFAGHMYEFQVSSINGDKFTDSDVQEVFIKPTFSLVKKVKVITLNNSTVLITWKNSETAVLSKLPSYKVTYVDLTAVSDPTQLKLYPGWDWVIHSNAESGNVWSYETAWKITNLTNNKYAFSILPTREENFGYEYQGDFNLLPYNSELPLATPDFEIIVNTLQKRDCHRTIRWLPCGTTFECKNTRPGSAFTVEIKYRTGHKITVEEEVVKNEACYSKYFLSDTRYEITVKSIEGSQKSNSSRKIFKCR